MAIAIAQTDHTAKRLVKLLMAIALLAALLALPGPAAAVPTTHWVNDDDPNGGGYSAPGTSCTDPGYATISAAVGPAASGDTIEVCAGTYMENIVLNESLTLLGEQADVDACGRVATESTVKPLNPAVMTIELDTGSASSVINGFTFSGPATRAIESDTGPIDGLQIRNNRIREFTNNGVFLNDDGLNITVDQNEIDGTAKVGGGGLFHLDQDNFDGFWFTNNCVVNGTTGTGFFVDGIRNVDGGSASARDPQFTDNFIDGNGTGVNLGRLAWGDGPISGNIFSNNLFDGLQGGPKDSLIEDNDFDSNGRNGLLLTSFGNTDPARGAQNNDILTNCFRENGFGPMPGAGITFSATQFPGTISTNEAHQNNIFGNFIGAQYLGAETIDAEQNWWGSPTGPTHVNNPGGTGDSVFDDGDGIDYDPFRISPAGDSPCPTPPPPSGKVTGGGQIAVTGGKGNFGFNVRHEDGVASGHLNYKNHVTGAHLNCTVALVTVLTPTMAEFSGPCSPQSDATSFMAEVEDNGEPGKDVDKFKITYNATTEGNGITAGNIQIQLDPEADAAEADASGAGAGTFPAGATFNGVSVSGLETGLGLSIAPDGAATGSFVAALLGASALGQPQEINVDGRVTSGTVGSDGSVTFNGTAAIEMGDGSLTLLGVPFTVTATTDSLLLELGTWALPSASLTGGSITIR
jgi:hypothetical protein